MRIKNLLIILAVIAAAILIIQYIRQVRNIRRGNRFVSGGRVFLNWLMAIILVGSLVGIGVQSFASRREASSEPTKVSEPVKENSESTEDVEVTVNFKKKVRLDGGQHQNVRIAVDLTERAKDALLLRAAAHLAKAERQNADLLLLKLWREEVRVAAGRLESEQDAAEILLFRAR